MTQIRFYLDEDSVEKSLVAGLRRAELEIVTVLEVGKQRNSDEQQLIWSAEQGLVIYTYNAGDFCRLHNEFLAVEKSHAGIIVSQQQQYSIGQ